MYVFDDPGKVDRAIAFIQRNTQASGALGTADPGIPDYPNYATALAVSALCRARRGDWRARIQPMVSYLRQQQFTEQNGWRPPDPAYGAWGMGGERRTPPDTGHVDLSMTRYVIESLTPQEAVVLSGQVVNCGMTAYTRAESGLQLAVFNDATPVEDDAGATVTAHE